VSEQMLLIIIQLGGKGEKKNLPKEKKTGKKPKKLKHSKDGRKIKIIAEAVVGWHDIRGVKG